MQPVDSKKEKEREERKEREKEGKKRKKKERKRVVEKKRLRTIATPPGDSDAPKKIFGPFFSKKFLFKHLVI